MFIPRRIIFEKGALDYEMGKDIYDYFKDNSAVEKIRINTTRVKEKIPGDNRYDFYREGKSTLVVGVKKGMTFQSCKPSAHYQLPLISGCTGQCQYCYLNTNLADKPYVKVNVNIGDILERAQKYMDERAPHITIFEGAATSDPLPVEPYTNALKTAIEFFGRSELGRFRFVSKYADVDTLLDADHKGKTEIRFTLNTEKVRTSYEGRTAPIENRIEAARKVSEAGYPLGFIIAPVFLDEGWKEDYGDLLTELTEKIPKNLVKPLTFEVISHRYTSRAKNVITEIFPENTLPMTDEERTFKYGQFGYGKYVYTKEQLADMKEFFTKEIEGKFPTAIIKYII